MRIINNETVKAAEIAEKINAVAAEVTEEQIARLMATAEICLPVFATDLEKEVGASFVYEAETAGDVDAFLLDGVDGYTLVVSTAFVDAGDVERKLMLMESLMDCVMTGPETVIDVHALNEEAGDDE